MVKTPCFLNAGGMGSVFGKGVKILHAMQPKRKISLNVCIYFKRITLIAVRIDCN